MHRLGIVGVCGCVLLGASCSKRERSDPDAEEWAQIQALADDPIQGAAADAGPPASGGTPTALEGEFDAFIARLAQMKAIGREAGETLLTGERLVLDHARSYVRMDENVVVEDDQGTLRAGSLVGRFSVSNKLEYVEAKGGVDLSSSNRTASAEQAIYDYRSGFVQLQGRAVASSEANSLSGERIELWIKGSRRMVCEPNALLVVKGAAGLEMDGVPSGGEGDTEIRADRVVFDEATRLAELMGNVRLRDPRAAMNCDNVKVFLKDDREIDWIEALGEVIIQADDRKALARRATYHADEKKFSLEGEPKVKQGQHVMTGDRINIWLEPRRMVCEPNARVLLYLDEETKAKFLKDIDK
ncbi:LptA/OstA family protein [Pontiella sp.]|uniref:LptA/OstA family protein n=1 Tax=Pontiella sp. TaxID=2837462 RepID=UPI00356702BB